MPAELVRVPTGDVDRILTVAVDWTAKPPLLILATLRRNPAEVSDDAFRPVHAITLQAQFGELLLERVSAARTRQAITHERSTAP